MKKNISVILAVVLLAELALVGFAETLLSVDGEGYYLISTANDLYLFAEIVNGGYEDANAKLVCDIVVNENVLGENGELNEGTFKAWYPIGDRNNYERINGSKFNGIFDGQGHTIYGLYYQSADDYRTDSGIGLFGAVGSGTIKDLKIKDTYFEACYHIGSICGYIYDGSIINCDSYATVKGNSTVSGICGTTISGTVPIFKYCSFYGCASGETRVSGICSKSYESIFEYCKNYGEITGSGSNVAGIVSGIGDYDIVSKVRRCSNFGRVSTVTSSYNYIGGICSFSTNTLFEDCLNVGEIVSTSSSSFVYAGGISGYGWGDIKNCLSYGKITVTSTNEKNCVGAIFGSATNNSKYQTTFTNNYYRKSATDAGVFVYGTSSSIVSEAGIAEAVEDEVLSNGTIMLALNNDRVSDAPWGQNIGTDAHPMLLDSPLCYLKALDQTKIDYTNQYVYSSEELLKDIFDIVEVLEVADCIAKPSHACDVIKYYGTGSTIGVYLDGYLAEEYTLIILGDTNGDSVTDVLDAAIVSLSANGIRDLDPKEKCAADLDCDGRITIDDYQSIINVVVAK